MRTLLLLTLAAILLPLAACKAKKAYPDPMPGWHASDYSVVFGRLQRVPSKDRKPALWMVRYGYADTDTYAGKLNLTPGEKLTGYAGGELVEIRGQLRPEFTHPEFSGTWYEINAIRIWHNEARR